MSFDTPGVEGGTKVIQLDYSCTDGISVGWDLIKQVGTSLLEGRDLIHVSLPVRVFEPRSFLQRLADSWLYAPLYLGTAGRMKGVLCNTHLERHL